MGREPRAFDLLYWNADQTRLPQKLHLFYLEKFYRKNALAEGDLRLGGRGLDLKKVKIPIYTVATKEDHIAPAVSVWRGGAAFWGVCTFCSFRFWPYCRYCEPTRGSKILSLDLWGTKKS